MSQSTLAPPSSLLVKPAAFIEAIHKAGIARYGEKHFITEIACRVLQLEGIEDPDRTQINKKRSAIHHIFKTGRSNLEMALLLAAAVGLQVQLLENRNVL